MSIWDGTGDGGGMDWGTIINIANTLYQHQQANKPPKFYNAPPTPEDAWTTQQKHNLFDYASGYANQLLQGIHSMPSPTFNATGAPTLNWAHLPSIDFSKLGAPNAPPSTSGTNTGGGGGGGNDTGSRVGGPETQSGSGGMGAGATGLPPGITGQAAQQFTSDFSPGGSYWTPSGNPTAADIAKWVSSHAGLLGLGAGVFAGPIGTAIAKAAGSLANWWLGGHTMGGAVPSNYTGSGGIGSLTPGADPSGDTGGGYGVNTGGFWTNTGQDLGGAPVNYYGGSLAPGGGGSGSNEPFLPNIDLSVFDSIWGGGK